MTTASWTFESATTAATTTAATSNEVVAFARRGVLIPFRRDNKLDFANGESVEVIKSNVQQILGTRCSDGRRVQGEIRWMQSFGSLLYKLRHQNIKPVVKFQARTYVVDALSRWEPRVQVRNVEIQDSERILYIRSSFTIIDGYGIGRIGDVFSVTNQIEKP